MWRLIAGTVAFAVWAPLGLAALPLAALLITTPAAPERTAQARALGALLGAAGFAVLVLSAGGTLAPRLAGATSAYIVLMTAAFVAVVLLRPASLLRQAARATLAGGTATALLVQGFWGIEGWRALAWEATRSAGLAMRVVVARAPDAFGLYEPIVRFLSTTTPGMLALQTLAGLGLAWRWHLTLARPPSAAPPARFREFKLSDGWIWGLVAGLLLVVVPVGGALGVTGANMGFVLGTLYTLRGAAIVAALAEAFGVSAAALLIAGGAAAALALPLLFLIPGLCTLGITDTWYEYRRRLAARGGGPRAPTT